jgi:hypothetical protein
MTQIFAIEQLQKFNDFDSIFVNFDQILTFSMRFLNFFFNRCHRSHRNARLPSLPNLRQCLTRTQWKNVAKKQKNLIEF